MPCDSLHVKAAAGVVYETLSTEKLGAQAAAASEIVARTLRVRMLGRYVQITLTSRKFALTSRHLQSKRPSDNNPEIRTFDSLTNMLVDTDQWGASHSPGSMDPDLPGKTALVRKRDSIFLSYLRCAKVACLGAGQRSADAFSLGLANPRAAQEQVQAVRSHTKGSTEASMQPFEKFHCCFRSCWGHCFTLIAELRLAGKDTLA